MGFEQLQVELQESMGSDRSIATSAWTSSYNKDKREQKSDEDVARVIKQMAENGHGVPFESVIFRFWIRMSIFTDRQFMTHRIASHSGLSGRYRTMPNDFYLLPDDVKDIIKKGISQLHENETPAYHWLQQYDVKCEEANRFYRDFISQLRQAEKLQYITNADFKRARELLRGVLPTAGMTERTSIFNLRSFANFQRQRNSSHAQPEIRQVAKLMLQEVKNQNICPIAISELENKGWVI